MRIDVPATGAVGEQSNAPDHRADSSRRVVRSSSSRYHRRVPTRPQTYAAPFANPDRFVALANLYAQLATSDVVRQILLQDGRLNGAIEAAPVATVNGVSVASLALHRRYCHDTPTGTGARQPAVAGFLTYLEREQQRSKIPAQQRVVLEVVKQPTVGELLKGRPKTLPVIVFMTVMLAVCGIAFALENLRPRIKPPIEEVRPAAVRGRRTA